MCSWKVRSRLARRPARVRDALVDGFDSCAFRFFAFNRASPTRKSYAGSNPAGLRKGTVAERTKAFDLRSNQHNRWLAHSNAEILFVLAPRRSSPTRKLYRFDSYRRLSMPASSNGKTLHFP